MGHYGRKRNSKNKGTAKSSSSKTISGDDAKTINQNYQFQLHGHKVKQVATYSIVLENLILKIQCTFTSPNIIVSSLSTNSKKAPKVPERTRVVVAPTSTDLKKDTSKFEKETVEFKFK